MSEHKPITKYVADWLTRANEDIRVAEILLKEGGLPNTICFHSQQAAEKHLKAYLAFQEKHIRKVHDLGALLSFCLEVDKSFSKIESEINYLSKFYIETRYPGDYPEFTLKDAQEASEAAQKIKGFVMSKIKNENE